MINTRITTTAAAFSLGLAALGGVALAIAGPANAESVPAPGSAATQEHVAFPKTGHEPHERFGRKGDDGINAVPSTHDNPILIGLVPAKTQH